MTTVGVLVAAIGAAAALGWIRRRWVVAVVDGQSMTPTFGPNDRVMVWRTRQTLRPGQVIVLERPHWRGGWRTGPLVVGARDRSWLIKRVSAVEGQPMPGEEGSCHSDRSSLRLIATMDPPPMCSDDGVVVGGDLSADYVANLEAVRFTIQSDPLSSPFYRRPTGMDSHPRVVVPEDDPCAALIIEWINRGAR